MSSNRAKIILAVVASLLICAAFYVFFVGARKSEVADVKAQVEEEESKSVSLEADLDRLQGLQANAAKFEARLAEIRELIPVEDQVANLVFQIQDAADKAGVSFVTVDPEFATAPLEGAAVAQVRVLIGADGGYFALQDFVRRLYDLDRALRIDTLSITGGDDDAEEEKPPGLSAIARIFFELPEGAAVPADGTAPAAPAPATETAPAS